MVELLSSSLLVRFHVSQCLQRLGEGFWASKGVCATRLGKLGACLVPLALRIACGSRAMAAGY